MNRKLLIWLLAIVLLITASPADSQPVGKIARAGVIAPGAPDRNPQVERFRQALRELGYVEGQTLHIDYRFTEGGTIVLPSWRRRWFA